MPPLWYRAREHKWVIVRDSTPYAKEIVDLPLGLIPGTPYTQTAIQLDPGDLLVLYTDGISESRNPSGLELGYEQFLEMASNIAVESPLSVGQSLFSCVETFRATAPATDDETIVVLQRKQNERAST